MARIINPERTPITMPTRHVVPAEGFVEVDNATLRECMRSIGGAVLAGHLSVEWDKEDEEVSEPPAALSPAPKKAKAVKAAPVSDEDAAPYDFDANPSDI